MEKKKEFRIIKLPVLTDLFPYFRDLRAQVLHFYSLESLDLKKKNTKIISRFYKRSLYWLLQNHGLNRLALVYDKVFSHGYAQPHPLVDFDPVCQILFSVVQCLSSLMDGGVKRKHKLGLKL